jgi:hypothetical protein
VRPLTQEEQLNRDCFCIDVNPEQVWSIVERAGGGVVPLDVLKAARPHLFSEAPVFLSAADLAAMQAVVAAIEAIGELPAFQNVVLGWAPEIAKVDPGPRGAFMGYDFHLTPEGPKLIEVNTNAGGAFLNALLAQAQVASCPEVQALIPTATPLEDFEAAACQMFEAEWRLQGRVGHPRVVAIIDERPEEQYLYPEFLLAQAFFERHGVEALIADPSDLRLEGGRLRLGGVAIELVYNRLVDFSFCQPEHAVIRQAYSSGAVVVTPNPRNHALLADKRNLTVLSDPRRLEELSVPTDLRRALAGLPDARLVTPENADELWRQRKALFFKPANGHAGKAVYRGDKLTRGVWETIVRGGYIAQDFAPPSERHVQVDGDPQPRKMDVRLYTYAGETMLAAARLYQGQTTNFRTPGGGFAPVITLA